MVSLTDKVDCLKGVGPSRVEALQQLGITSIYDLLTHFPFRYEDLSVRSIETIEDREKVVLNGPAISEAIVNYMGYKKSRLQFRMNVEHVIVPVTFFNQPYLKDKVSAGENLYVYGTWDLARKSLTGIKILNDLSEDGEREAIYPSNKGIKVATIYKLIQEAWKSHHHLLKPLVSKELLDKYQLYDFPEAVEKIHFPNSSEEMALARKSLVFMELLLYQLKLMFLNLKRRRDEAGKRAKFDVKELRDFAESLPFQLTNAQKRVVNEICKDFLSPYQMNRLLQGDVGSGKTAVAGISIFAMKTAGFQSAIMAPTEILASQHYQTFTEMFADEEMALALLTSSTPSGKRQEILEDLASGDLDLLIGTHALIQEDVQFSRLNYTIIDEQHRFGVNQRRLLREKGQNPNILYMTATPIPRTLSITTYGEMDLSVIDEMPKGRKPVKTIWIRPKQMNQMGDFLLKELHKKSQAYVISALIEESEFVDSENATELFQIYQNLLGPKYQVGLLHGRMTTSEKDEIMTNFEEGHLDVLVSTTVVEVGVNVPNATLMIIHDADKFGLAQLHQLRGRVGRGNKASYCVLIADPKSDQGIERMTIMTETNDGFLLSEKDLEMRGAGDIFGSKQSGLPDFKIANIIEDQDLLNLARQEAILMLSTENRLKDKENSNLFDKININQETFKEIFD